MTKDEQIQEIGDIIDTGIIYGNSNYGMPTVSTVNSIAETIYSKDYRKVERGEWIPYGMNMTGTVGNWKCSACNETSIKSYDYCPNCGADMRGEQNDKD